MQKIIFLLVILFVYQSNGQNLRFHSIDNTNFPIVKAKVKVYDNTGNTVTNFNKSDFLITENDKERKVLKITCPQSNEPTAVSSVLTVDISGSMTGNNIQIAKEAANAWVKGLPLGRSECALTTFNTSNQFLRDFTTNRNTLLESIKNLGAGGGTSFDAAFINPIAGGLLALEKAKYKKVMVLITDGYADGSETQILNKANAIGATVYCVTLGYQCPMILRNIAEKTSGKWFENVTSIDEARNIYLEILEDAQGGEPCDIEWESAIACEPDVELNVKYKPFNLNFTSYYSIPGNSLADIDINPYVISFPKLHTLDPVDTTITITARYADFKITNINSNNPEFKVSPEKFDLKAGESKTVNVTYTPTKATYAYAKFEIVSTTCDFNFYVSAYHANSTEIPQTLKVTHPNGGENFLVGSDTIITWEGILPNDNVDIEYTIDNGTNWKSIVNNVSGLSYNWTNIPKPGSKQCKVKVSKRNIPADNEYLLKTLGGHAGYISNVSWSPDGNRIATSSGEDNTCKIWDVSTGSILFSLGEHTKSVFMADWSPDGSRVATASADYNAIIWDVNTGRILHKLTGHTSLVYEIAWSPDGSKIASASQDGDVKVWDAFTGSEIRTLSGHSYSVSAISWSPDGIRLASASADQSAKIWDTETGNVLHTLSSHYRALNDIEWSPDGKKILTASQDSRVIIWNSQTGDIIRTLSGQNNKEVIEAKWSPDGTMIAASIYDGSAIIWNANNGDIKHTFKLGYGNKNTVAWSPDSKKLATGGGNKELKVWNVVSGQEIYSKISHTKQINHLSWNFDGSKIATVSQDQSAIIWDASNGNVLNTCSGHTETLKDIAWSPNGLKFATASDDNTIIIWNPKTAGKELILKGHNSGINNIDWNDDGSKIVSSSNDHSAIIWDAKTGSKLYSLKEQNNVVNFAYWNPNGTKVATSSPDGTVLVWNPANGNKLLTLSHVSSVTAISWSPDGKMIATASSDYTAKIWDATTGNRIIELNSYLPNLRAIKWSSDASMVATLTDNSFVKVWDVATGNLLNNLNAHTGVTTDFQWSPKSNKIATTSKDQTAIVWDPKTGNQLITFKDNGGAISKIAWSPDGSIIATASEDKSIKIWKADQGRLVQIIKGNSAPITKIEWNPDGNSIATSSADNLAKIWSVEADSNKDQVDISDETFTIALPLVASRDIDMGDVIINTSEDKMVQNFLENTSSWACRIDSIYFTGADAKYFKLNGPTPVYTVATGEKLMSEFKFSPTELRDYSAQVVIVTQVETLSQNIRGRGVEPSIQTTDKLVNFGIRELFDYKDSTVVLIENVSNNPVDITKIEMIGPDFEQFLFMDSTQIAPLTLNGHTSYKLDLRFNPKYMGRSSGQIAFHFNGPGSPAIAQLYGAGIGAEVSASKDTAYVGDVVGIDIRLQNTEIDKFAEVIGSFEGIVRVESSILGPLYRENLEKVVGDSAYIKFKGEVSSGTEILTTIPLKSSLGRVESTSIDFEQIRWFDTDGNAVDYDTDFLSGYFKQIGICEEGGKRFFNPNGETGIGTLSPNPAEDKIHIDFSVTEEGYTEITMINLMGETVATFFAEDVSDFQERQIIADVSELGSGQYILQFKTPTYIERHKVVVVR